MIIKKFVDGSLLEYGRGRFDNWCVFLSRPNQNRYAPKDIEYFTRLKNIGSTHGYSNVYDNFVEIYELTSSNINKKVLQAISARAQKFGNDALEIDILFSILYAAMVAEENKENTKLGKRIKRLGVHQLLIENMSPVNAANHSKGKSWRQIDAECKTRGF
ncbi:DUF7004 family protein [Desulfallas thermosapovorans]|uniref:Uncharacterized protein n=1 Tax=Desulfallas thermosapovorans DSM 6562 TaxID=1121431 RepID=A0A5S4ZNM4_9FIRM|nr:hypothetical protein [Desulfallas thermosapovorans]TYO94426.1 hypothetical protein LX24_02410 [Desulfallas thermosapovorans DSM 6562]